MKHDHRTEDRAGQAQSADPRRIQGVERQRKLTRDEMLAAGIHVEGATQADVVEARRKIREGEPLE